MGAIGAQEISVPSASCPLNRVTSALCLYGILREEFSIDHLKDLFVPVDDHLDSNVLKDEPEEAKQSWLPLHVAQASFPAH